MARLLISADRFNSSSDESVPKYRFYEIKSLVPGEFCNVASETVILSEGDKICTEIDRVRLTGIIIS